jgi:hypothetical protein
MPAFGGPNWFFVEDSTIDFSQVDGNDGAFDCQNGGYFVFRHNTILGTGTINHGYDSVDAACLAMEVYNNTFTYNESGSWWVAGIGMRGGTAIIHDNTMTGNYTDPIRVCNYRSCQYGYCGDGLCDASAKGWCDGSTGAVTLPDGNAVPADGNTSPTSTYHGWPCVDQIGRGAKQASFPLYQWNNTYNGNAITDITVYDNYNQSGGTCYNSTQIVSGRDYINSAMPGYTPYTYPHPLQNAGIPAPTNLHLVQ